jgi:hypothetical protein
MRFFDTRVTTTTLATAAAVLIIGCGGSGPGTGITGGNGGSGGSGGTGGTISHTQRTAVMDAVEQILATAPADFDARNAQVMTYLNGRSEIVEAGISPDKTIWAHFSDGRMWVIGDALTHSVIPPLRSRSASRNFDDFTSAIPQDLDVVVLNTLGPNYEIARAMFAEAFEGQTYTVHSNASVEFLKNMPKLGAFYMQTHAGEIKLRNSEDKLYAVWTGSNRAKDGSTDEAHAADLADGSLTYFTGRFWPNAQQQGFATRYAFTERFVSKYWSGKFGKGSFFFLNGCNSQTEAAEDFKFMVAAAGAKAFAGWTSNVVGGDALVTAAFIFDALLGGTLGTTEPPTRAFNYDDIWLAMEQTTRPDKPYSLLDSMSPTHAPAKLELDVFGQPQSLAPSIERLHVQENDGELILTGIFGSDEGVVFLGDDVLQVLEWEPHQIRCKITPSQAGPVKVVVHGAQTSNFAVLAKWTGTASYLLKEAGSLMEKIDFSIQFRGDPRDFRNRPGENPVKGSLLASHSLVTSASYVASGSYSDDGYSVSWSGSGQMQAAVLGQFNPTSVTLEVGLTRNNTQAWMNLFGVAHQGKTEVVTVGGQTTTSQVQVAGPTPGLVDQTLGAIPLNFNPTTWQIQGGTRTVQIPSDHSDGHATATLTWTAFTPSHIDEPGWSRSPKRKR